MPNYPRVTPETTDLRGLEFNYGLEHMISMGSITTDLLFTLKFKKFTEQDEIALTGCNLAEFESFVYRETAIAFESLSSVEKAMCAFTSLITYEFILRNEFVKGLAQSTAYGFFKSLYPNNLPRPLPPSRYSNTLSVPVNSTSDHILEGEAIFNRINNEIIRERITAGHIFADQFYINWIDNIKRMLGRITPYLFTLSDEEMVDALIDQYIKDEASRLREFIPPPSSKNDQKQDRRKIKAVRKSIVRALTTATPILGNSLMLFIKGEGFIIEGVLFNYRISKINTVVEETDHFGHSIPYRLEILNKSNQLLCRGCVVFDNTPILDQIIALTLHVKDRESEIELMKKTNKFDRTEEYFVNSDVTLIDDVKKNIPIINSDQNLINIAYWNMATSVSTAEDHQMLEILANKITPLTVAVLSEEINNPLFDFMFNQSNAADQLYDEIRASITGTPIGSQLPLELRMIWPVHRERAISHVRNLRTAIL